MKNHIQEKNEVTLLQVTNIRAGVNAGNYIKKRCNEMDPEKLRLNTDERSAPVVLRSGFPHQVQMTTHHPTQLKVVRFLVPTAHQGT